MRCCLILLTSEDASALGRPHPHLPLAFRAAMARVWGMTEFHRPERGRWERFRTTRAIVFHPGAVSGVLSSPGMTRAGGGPTRDCPGNRNSG
jgi:hypothetical protein